ncbi:hypothetical protein PG984_015039 [Apiospora sp. TS-2023a]
MDAPNEPFIGFSLFPRPELNRFALRLGYDVKPREVVYDKNKEVLYIPRVFNEVAVSGKLERVFVGSGPEPPLQDIAIGVSNPYGFHLYSHGGGVSAYVTRDLHQKGKLWIDTDKGEMHLEPNTSLKSRPSVSGNYIEEVDLASAMIVGRVTADFFTTPGDAESGLLQFSSQDARNCPRANEGQPPLLAITNPVAQKVGAHFRVGKIYIMPKEVMLVQ